MAIRIYPVDVQVKGNFNNGEILENKPIQISPDTSKLQPYSNLFYWAHAWAETTSTIGLHPHKAFEIISFVLEGTIEHYDTKNKTWIPLNAGDVQIIRAGNGISHAEKVIEGGHIFQIWFDPNINQSLNEPASYNDYTAESFPVIKENGFTTKILKGENAPLQMNTPGIAIKEISFEAGTHTLPLNENEIHSIYLIKGAIELNGNKILANDFFVAESETAIQFQSEDAGKLFIISSLKKVPYKTYAEMA